MAQTYEPTPLGTRLADFRSKRRLSAAALASKIGDPGVTRAVITNIETGRKPDPAVSEIMKIADGLDISPLALMVDTSKPWEALDTPNVVAGRLRELSAAEYARSSNIYGGHSVVGFGGGVLLFLEALIECEVQLSRAAFVRERLDSGEDVDPSTVDGSFTDEGEYWTVAGYEVTVEGLANDLETVVAAYRGAVAAREQQFAGQPGTSRVERLSARFERRLDNVRRAVVAIIAEYPDVDYGQRVHRGRWGHVSTPPLDPETGHSLRTYEDQLAQGRGAGSFPPIDG